MADLSKTIETALSIARTLSSVIPGLAAVGPMITVGEKAVQLLDDLMDKAPDQRTQEEMQAARRELAAAVSAKAERTADRFDG